MLAAGFYNRTSVGEVKAMISEAGFTPAQRLTNYEIVQEFRRDSGYTPVPVPVTSG